MYCTHSDDHDETGGARGTKGVDIDSMIEEKVLRANVGDAGDGPEEVLSA